MTTTYTLDRPAPADTTKDVVAQASPKGTLKTMPISVATYVTTLQSAMISSRYALQLEVAVCLGVYLERGAADREAKKTLYEIYNRSGWECLGPDAKNYKTVNRRINSAAALWGYLGASAIEEAIGGKAEALLINAIVDFLAPLNLTSVDAILSYTGRPRLPTKPVSAPTLPAESTKKEMTGADLIKSSEERIASGAKEPITVGETAPQAAQTEQPIETLEPGELRLNEPSIAAGTEEPEDELQPHHYMRRSSDFPEAAANDEQFIIVETENIHVSIPVDVDRAELMACIIKMMEIAETLEISAETVTEVVEEAPKGKLQEEMQRVVKTTVKAEKEDVVLQAELKNTPEPMKRGGKTSKATGTVHRVKR